MGWEEKKVALVWRGRESVSESVTVRDFDIFLFLTGWVWIMSIPYPNNLDNIHTLSD